jgi:hypothetical protein
VLDGAEAVKKVAAGHIEGERERRRRAVDGRQREWGVGEWSLGCQKGNEQ